MDNVRKIVSVATSAKTTDNPVAVLKPSTCDGNCGGNTAEITDPGASIVRLRGLRLLNLCYTCTAAALATIGITIKISDVPKRVDRRPPANPAPTAEEAAASGLATLEIAKKAELAQAATEFANRQTAAVAIRKAAVDARDRLKTELVQEVTAAVMANLTPRPDPEATSETPASEKQVP